MHQQYRSDDDNYLQLSQQSAGSGASGSSAGPRPYHNSYPLHDTHNAKAAKGYAAAPPHTMSGPMTYTTGPAAPQPPQRPYVVYPEVTRQRPPPISAALTAPSPAYGQQAYMPPPMPAGKTYWGQGADVHHAAAAYPSPQSQQHQQLGMLMAPPTAPPPQPPAIMAAETIPPQSARPAFQRMPRNSRPPRPAGALGGYSRPLNAPNAFYPQSAPISPTMAYDNGYAAAAPMHPHTYHQVGDAAYQLPGMNIPPLSAPVPPLPVPPPQQLSYAPRPLVQPPASAQKQYPQQGYQNPTPWIKSPPTSSGTHDSSTAARLAIAYLRNGERMVDRTKFNTVFHCLKPVELVNKSSVHYADNREHHPGSLYPLYKVNEEWISPNTGLPFKNKPGYRCIIYIIDGTLLYDNGISGSEKLLSKGTVHMFTGYRDISMYARNPSKTHRTHILRMWIETAEYVHNSSTSTADSDMMVPAQRIPGHRRPSEQVSTPHPDFHSLVRHVADSDKQNYLLVLAQPNNYLASFGMTSRIYGPLVVQPKPLPKDSLADIRSGSASPLESSYCLSQSRLFNRPEYFTPEPIGMAEDAEAEEEWEVTDPQLNSRVCADPLKVEEDIFIATCQLESDSKVIYEPYDLHDKNRAQQKQATRPARGNRRRVWIQALMADLNPNASANGGRLVINGDSTRCMYPGDSAYVRRLELNEKLVIENTGRVPIDFVIVETPY